MKPRLAILCRSFDSLNARSCIVKMKTLITLVIVAGLLLVCRPLSAHHGAAAYDMSKAIPFKDAVVTKYSWINPHALIFFDVKDEAGKVTHWSAETGSPIAIGVVGWSRNSVKVGDVVTIWVFQAKNGQSVGRLNRIQFADGSMLRDTQVGGDKGDRSDEGLR
jgi:hypothetical protein